METLKTCFFFTIRLIYAFNGTVFSGMVLQSKAISGTEEDLTNLTSRSKSGTQESSESPVMSADELEWDTEFTASEDKDTQNLLKAEIGMGVR